MTVVGYAPASGMNYAQAIYTEAGVRPSSSTSRVIVLGTRTLNEMHSVLQNRIGLFKVVSESFLGVNEN
jgi:hypothetical protein